MQPSKKRLGNRFQIPGRRGGRNDGRGRGTDPGRRGRGRGPNTINYGGPEAGIPDFLEPRISRPGEHYTADITANFVPQKLPAFAKPPESATDNSNTPAGS